jgi:carbamoyl-phosphate synthase large subunit
MKNPRCLVTAIGGSGYGEQILKALKLAESFNPWILGADRNPNVHQMDWVDEAINLPSASEDGYISELLTVCLKKEIQFLFHGSEPEMRVISSNRDLFEANGIILVINSEEVIKTCSDKIQTSEFLKANGFQTPKFVLVDHLNDSVGELVDFFPVVVKPYRESGGSANVFICQSRNELENIFRYLVSSGSKNLMIQEYVGSSESEYTIGVLSDFKGLVIDSIGVKRNLRGGLNIRSRVPNRVAIDRFGKELVVSSGISEGLVGRFQNITKQCEEMAIALKSVSAINFQCRVVDGIPWVFEINPRLSGTSSLRAIKGFNEPEILINSLLFPNLQKRVNYREGMVERGLVEYEVKHN